MGFHFTRLLRVLSTFSGIVLIGMVTGYHSVRLK